MLGLISAFSLFIRTANKMRYHSKLGFKGSCRKLSIAKVILGSIITLLVFRNETSMSPISISDFSSIWEKKFTYLIWVVPPWPPGPLAWLMDGADPILTDIGSLYDPLSSISLLSIWQTKPPLLLMHLDSWVCKGDEFYNLNKISSLYRGFHWKEKAWFRQLFRIVYMLA